MRKLAPALLRKSLALAFSDEILVVDWVNRGLVKENWGDAIAPVIASRLSGKRVVNNRDVVNVRHRTVYTTIGSMFASIDVQGFEVWGTGFVDSRGELRARPGRIHAVRGPLTYKKIRDAGIECPEVFGDPATLFPMIYRSRQDKACDLGVIPHFKELDLPAVEALRSQGAHIIDIRGGIFKVVDEINRCRRIASSSLHGLVAADAYGLPAIWVRFSDRPAGDGFKFRDYLESTSSRRKPPLLVDARTTLAQVEDQFEPDLPLIDSKPLLDSCPFLDSTRILPDGSVS